MQLSIQSRGVYVPAWNDNRKLPEEEQVKVHWRLLSTAERQDLYQLEPSEDEKQPLKVVMPKNAEFFAQIERIEGLTVDLDGEPKEVGSGEVLCATPGLEALYAELWKFLQTIGSIDKKK